MDGAVAREDGAAARDDVASTPDVDAQSGHDTLAPTDSAAAEEAPISCSPASCGGCCRADGVCASGDQDSVCGNGGVSCVDCLTAGSSCVQKTCSSCTPACKAKLCGASDGCGGTCKTGSGCCPPGTMVHQGKCAHVLRVLSYNIAGYMYDPKNKSKPLYGNPEPQLQKLAALIKKRGVHLAGLQEVENNATWHNNVHMHNRLLTILSSIGYPMQGKFQKRFNAHGGELGLTLLSRFPITSYKAHLVTTNVYLQSAGVAFHGEPIRFYNYHPYAGTASACNSTTSTAFKSAITAYLGQTSVVTGDFNFTRSAPCYSTMTATHIDTCSQVGGGTCLSTVDKTIRIDLPPGPTGIDYAFARFAGANKAKWKVYSVDADQKANQGLVMSDHLPVFAKLIRFQ